MSENTCCLDPARNSRIESLETDQRRFVKGLATLAGAAPIFGSSAVLNAAESRDAEPGCSKWNQPADADFDAIIARYKTVFIDRALSLIENEMVPKTMEGVKGGSKLFGAAVLKKSDLCTVRVATNTEADNPLFHGEITAINTFYAIPKDKRSAAKDVIFISSHEPCPLCHAGITWRDSTSYSISSATKIRETL